jgi:hypothetical protein
MTRRTIELLAFVAALLLATLAFHAWLASHDEQQRLQATLAAQKQLLDAADAREHDRNAALNVTLAQIAQLKSSTQTPEQILRNLQQELSLPQPLTLATPPAAAQNRSAGLPVRQAGNLSAHLPLPLPSPSLSPPPSSPLAAQQGTAASENPPPPAQDEPHAAPDAPRALSASADQQNLPAAPTAQIPSADLKPLFDFVQDCRACQAQLAVAKQNSADDAAKIAALTRERDAAITASKGGTFWRRLRRNALWLAAGAAAGYVAAKR